MLTALLALFAAVGGAAAVPDARIAIDGVETSTTEPVVGERTSLNVTVSNSGGSPAAADVTSVRVVGAGNDAEPLDKATAVGALSAGDSLDVELWTRFDEPGERRLTVEVVAEAEATGGDEEGETVTVTRDVVVDVQPAEVTLDLRTRGLAPEDLQSDEEEGNAGGVGVSGIEGIFGGGGGGLDTGEDAEEAVLSADSPVAVTVVNTGTTTADRVSLTAVGEPIAGGVTDGEGGADDEGRAGIEAGPYVVEDVAPGEERRVVVDLGPLDRRSAVTFTAAFRSGLDAQAGAGAERTATSTLRYPTHDAAPAVTDATVETTGGGEVLVDANLGNAGGGELEGVVVSVEEAPGVAPTPAGGEYFVGAVGAGDFVAFDLRTTANASVASAVPIRIAYTERGVRYVETDAVAIPDAEGAGSGGSGTVGTLGSAGGLGSVGTLGAVGLAGAAGLAVVGGVVRRRDV
ncbi:CARDB domain-containing protein [Halorubrum yunnanense]|uniref:CARDB domain-containing protein n=1 Tax=Halorubrum yunnanense TaxID=1526162 RepID=A0ABD5YFI9_9EURY|nr:CARDB domain-containing protein [Halorubrum yunnanense]